MKPQCMTIQRKAIAKYFHISWSVFVCTDRTHVAGTVQKLVQTKRIEAYKCVVVYSLQEEYTPCDIEN